MDDIIILRVIVQETTPNEINYTVKFTPELLSNLAGKTIKIIDVSEFKIDNIDNHKMGYFDIKYQEMK